MLVEYEQNKQRKGIKHPEKQNKIQIFRAIFIRMNVSILKVLVCLKEVLGCWGLRSRHPTCLIFWNVQSCLLQQLLLAVWGCANREVCEFLFQALSVIFHLYNQAFLWGEANQRFAQLSLSAYYQIIQTCESMFLEWQQGSSAILFV